MFNKASQLSGAGDRQRSGWVVIEGRQAGGAAAASTEDGGEASTERCVHEAVGDGMTAGGREGEQVDEVHR